MIVESMINVTMAVYIAAHDIDSNVHVYSYRCNVLDHNTRNYNKAKQRLIKKVNFIHS